MNLVDLQVCLSCILAEDMLPTFIVCFQMTEKYKLDNTILGFCELSRSSDKLRHKLHNAGIKI